MPLEPEQTKWVAAFTGNAAALCADPLHPTDDELLEMLRVARIKEEIKDQQDREAYLAKAFAEVDKRKADLRKALIINLKTKQGEISTLGAGGDQTQGFAFTSKDDIDSLTEMPTGKQLALLNQARRDFTTLGDGLLDHKSQARSAIEGRKIVVSTSAELFTKKEVMDSFFEPLVRERICPEDLVPDEYSKTLAMIKGSNDAYLKEIANYKEPEKFPEGLEVASSVVAGVAKVATAGIEKVFPEHAKIAKAAMDLISTVATTSLETAAQVTRKQYQNGMDKAAEGVAKVFESVIKQVTKNEDLAKLVGLGITGSVKLEKIVSCLVKDPPEITEAAAVFGAAINSGFEAAASTTEEKTTQGVIKSVGSAIEKLFSAGATAAKDKIVEKARNGDFAGVTAILTGVASNAATAVTGIVAASKTKDTSDTSLTEEEKKSREESNKAIEELKEKVNVTAEESLKALGELSKLASGSIEKKRREEEEKAEKEKKKKNEEALQANELLAQNLNKKLEEERESYVKSLSRLTTDTDPSVEDMKSIAKLIEKIENDRKILETAASLGAAGAKVAGQFFGPLAAAGTLVDFLVTLAAAIDRGKALRKWLDAQGDALNAASPYMTSIQNFAKNQGEQLTHYSLKSATLLLKAGGQIAKAAGPAAPVGAVIEAIGSGAESLEDGVYKFYRADALKKAWAATKKALENPDDRKAGLLARSLNPTLAKYTLAYGAIVDKDAMARLAMERCGLGMETLAQKDSNVQQVKKYLETLYKDDLVVKGEFTPPGWKGRPAKLELKNWVLNFNGSSSDNPVKGGNPHAIINGFKALEKHAAIKDDARDEAGFDQYIEELRKLRLALTSYKPVNEKDGKSSGLAALLPGYVTLVETRLDQVEMAKLEKFAVLPQL